MEAVKQVPRTDKKITSKCLNWMPCGTAPSTSSSMSKTSLLRKTARAVWESGIGCRLHTTTPAYGVLSSTRQCAVLLQGCKGPESHGKTPSDPSPNPRPARLPQAQLIPRIKRSEACDSLSGHDMGLGDPALQGLGAGAANCASCSPSASLEKQPAFRHPFSINPDQPSYSLCPALEQRDAGSASTSGGTSSGNTQDEPQGDMCGILLQAKRTLLALGQLSGKSRSLVHLERMDRPLLSGRKQLLARTAEVGNSTRRSRLRLVALGLSDCTGQGLLRACRDTAAILRMAGCCTLRRMRLHSLGREDKSSFNSSHALSQQACADTAPECSQSHWREARTRANQCPSACARAHASGTLS